MRETSISDLRQDIRRLRTEVAAAGRESATAGAEQDMATPPPPKGLRRVALEARGRAAPAPSKEPASTPSEAPTSGDTKTEVGSPAPVPASPEISGTTKTTPGVETGAGEGGSPPPPEDPAIKLAALEAKFQELTDKQRLKNVAYLRKVGKKTRNGALIALVVAAVLILFLDWPIRRNSGFQMACWAALVVWLVVVGISAMKHADGGVTPMLLGKDGRFSTSHFQAWVWTLMIGWGFAFLIIAGLAAGNLDGFKNVADNLDADYFLLLGGPFAALVVAKAVTTAKATGGDLQQVSTEESRVTDVLSTDDGRTDLVDTQYLFFNFVALAAFLALFALNPTVFPDLPDGLVMLTSASALAYVANKAVAKNAPGILSITLESGTGTPKVGDTIRIHGFNFVPSGAATEESLTRVRVRFSGVETPVAPPASNKTDPAVNASAATPEETSTTTRAPSLYVDNATATDLRVEIPPLPGIQLPGTVEVTVITAAGIETKPPYSLTIGASG